MRRELSHEPTLAKKLASPAVYAAGSPIKFGKLLRIDCKNTNYRFLIDTGSVVSIIPAAGFKNLKEPDGHLHAANGTIIPTYGTKILKVDLGLGMSHEAEFLIADVTLAIIGADFLTKHNISVNMKAGKIENRNAEVNCIKQDPPVVHSVTTTNDHRVEKLLNKYPELTKVPEVYPEPKHNFVHYIPTKDGDLPYCRPRNLPPKMLNIAKQEFERMEKQGIVTRATSNCSSPIHIVPKKDSPDSPYRIVCDFRRINKLVERDVYPLPFLHNFSKELYGKRVFGKLDVKQAYFSIPVAKEDRHKTCVVTPFGSFIYNRLPFGLSNACQSFQQFMDRILCGLTRTDENGEQKKITIFNYVDDILIASENEKEHEKDLDAVLRRLADYGMILSVHKCEFFKDKLTFLGHDLSKDGFSAAENKVRAILDLPLPKNLGQLRRALGLINFYHRFMNMAADKLAPLNEFLKGYKKTFRSRLMDWKNNREAAIAFEEAKQELAKKTLLQYPSIDGKLIVTTDSSDLAVGGIVEEIRGDKTVPLGFFSKKLDKNERKMSAFGRELLAIFLTVKHFRAYLEGAEFKILTDHAPIISAAKNDLDRPIPKESRWLSYILSHKPEIVHIKGKDNIIADALSRTTSQITCNLVTKTLTVNSELKRELMKAQQDCVETEEFKNCVIDTLKLELFDGLYCNKFQGHNRIFVPKSLRNKIMTLVHGMDHPGAKTTVSRVQRHFVWPNMKKEVREFAQTCLDCQRNKVSRHNRAPIHNIPMPSCKFSKMAVDIVGPLPACEGYSYILTFIDMFSGFPDAVPLRDVTAKTIADAVYFNFFCRYGLPRFLVTDRGSVFTSAVFQRLLTELGIEHRTTLAWTPRQNSRNERLHRSMKSHLKARFGTSNSWINDLASFLWAKRAAINEETGVSPAHMVYGEPIRVPYDLLNHETVEYNPHSYVDTIRKSLKGIIPKPRPIYIKGWEEKDLRTSRYVFVKNNAKKGLQPTYKGPYQVVERHEKYFLIDFGGKTDKITIDRLKTAHVKIPEGDEDIVKFETTHQTQGSSEPITPESPSELRQNPVNNPSNNTPLPPTTPPRHQSDAAPETEIFVTPPTQLPSPEIPTNIPPTNTNAPAPPSTPTTSRDHYVSAKGRTYPADQIRSSARNKPHPPNNQPSSQPNTAVTNPQGNRPPSETPNMLKRLIPFNKAGRKEK